MKTIIVIFCLVYSNCYSVIAYFKNNMNISDQYLKIIVSDDENEFISFNKIVQFSDDIKHFKICVIVNKKRFGCSKEIKIEKDKIYMISHEENVFKIKKEDIKNYYKYFEDSETSEDEDEK